MAKFKFLDVKCRYCDNVMGRIKNPAPYFVSGICPAHLELYEQNPEPGIVVNISSSDSPGRVAELTREAIKKHVE